MFTNYSEQNTKKQIRVLKTPSKSISNSAERAQDQAWSRTHDTTIALLEQAYNRIDETEKRLEAQQERIKVLEKLASTDEMTSILNRRGFETAVESEISRLQRGRSDGGLFILIDLDKFKPINDTHGHLAGDACLRLVSSTLKRLIRTTDACARLGGDEFAILLTDMNVEKRNAKANEIKRVLNSLKLDWQRQSINIRCSMGVASYNADSRFLDVYQKADEGLYGDKNTSR